MSNHFSDLHKLQSKNIYYRVQNSVVGCIDFHIIYILCVCSAFYMYFALFFYTRHQCVLVLFPGTKNDVDI
jgi:hypothetical protein